MIKSILITLIIIFSAFKFAFSENSEINLLPKNPNLETTIISTNEESNNNEINEIDLKENNQIEIFNNSEEIDKDLGSNDNLNNLANVWENSDKKNINFLFKKLNYNIASKTIKSNLIDVLVYGINEPKGMNKAEFDKLRILKLKSLGQVDVAINVISSISTYEANKDIYDKIILEKSLVDYNLAAVCGILDSNSEFKTDAYLIKIKVFCSFLNDQIEEADFFNSLLLEENDDEYFQALYNKLIKIDNNLGGIKEYKYDNESLTLYSAIMRSENIPFTDDFIQLNSPQLLKSIAISPVTDISVRLNAAQKAYDLDSFDSESVAALYQSADFSSDELNNPINTIEKKYSDDNQIAMALLFQSSRIQILPISRLEALNNFWEYANNTGQSKLAYELSKDLLKSIEPSSELVDFAINTAKAHLYNNKIEEAKKWLKLIQARINIEENTNIDKDYLQLIFLMSIHEGNFNFEDKLYDDFINSLNIENDDINNLELYLTTLEFIGFIIPENLWEITAKKVKDDRKVPSIYIMKLLNKSANNNLTGELFLCIAVSLEDNNWLGIHPQHIDIIFKNLKKIKKDEIIKKLTLEILEDMS